MDLNTEAIIVGVGLFLSYPPEQILRLHATAEIGYFRSVLTAAGSILSVPGEVNDNDSSLGFDVGAGLFFSNVHNK